MAQSEIEAAKERHIRVSAGESLTNVYNRPDGVFAEFEHILIAEGMHANDCRILADAYVSQQSQPVNERLLIALIEISESFDALAKEAAKAERAWRKTIPGADIPGDRQKSRRKRRGGYLKGKKR